MQTEPRKRRKWPVLAMGIGLGLLILVALLISLRFIAGTSVFSQTIHLVTYVNDAAGLQKGAVVSLQGVRIGNVSGIRISDSPPDPAQPVRIDMRVSARQQEWLRENSTVQVTTHGTMGDAAVNIGRGTPDSPPATNGTILPSRVATPTTAVVISAHTLLENTTLLMNQFSGMVGHIKSGTVGKMMGPNELDRRLNRISRDTGSLRSAIDSGSGTLGKLTSSPALTTSLRSTRDSVASLRRGIASGNGSMAQFLHNRQFSGDLAGLRENIHQTAAGLRQGQGAVGGLLQASSPTRRHLNGVSAGLQAMGSADGSLHQFTTDPRLARSTQALSQNLHSLIHEMRANPNKFFRIHLDLF